MKRPRLLRAVFLLLGVFFALPAVAADSVSVSAEVDRTAIALGDTLALTVSVSAVSEVEGPILPPSLKDGFDVLPSGKETQVQIANWQMETRSIYSYLLSPKQAGTFVIAPIAVRVGGKDYQTEAITVQIADNGGGGSGGFGPPPSPGPDPKSEGQSPPEGDSTAPYFVTAELGTSSLYVHQELLYTFRLYTREGGDIASFDMPAFKGMRVEDLVPERKFYETVGPYRYLVAEMIVALFPLKAGEIEIPPAQLEFVTQGAMGSASGGRGGLFDFPFSMGRREKKLLTTKGFKIEVQPLPEPEPENFSNLVGDFSLGVSIDRTALSAQDSAAISVELRGHGNIDEAVLPPWDLGEGLKVYDDRPETELERKPEGLFGVKRFKRAVVPLHGGDYRLPPLVLSVFNPKSGEYETLSSEDLALAVQGASGGDGAANAQRDRMPEETTNPAEETSSAAADVPRALEFEPIASLDRPTFEIESWPRAWWVVFFGFPPAVALVVGMGKVLWAHRLSRLPERQKNGAFRDLHKALAQWKREAPSVQEAGVDRELLTRVLEGLRRYFAQLYGMPAQNSAGAEWIGFVAGKISFEDEARFKAAVEAIEAAVYGGGPCRARGFREDLTAIDAILCRFDREEKRV